MTLFKIELIKNQDKFGSWGISHYEIRRELNELLKRQEFFPPLE
jgi:hypothetical protein